MIALVDIHSREAVDVHFGLPVRLIVLQVQCVETLDEFITVKVVETLHI